MLIKDKPDPVFLHVKSWLLMRESEQSPYICPFYKPRNLWLYFFQWQSDFIYKLILSSCVKIPKKNEGIFFYNFQILLILMKLVHTMSIGNQKEEYLLNILPHE